jgi:hypothetical protein
MSDSEVASWSEDYWGTSESGEPSRSAATPSPTPRLLSSALRLHRQAPTVAPHNHAAIVTPAGAWSEADFPRDGGHGAGHSRSADPGVAKLRRVADTVTFTRLRCSDTAQHPGPQPWSRCHILVVSE